MNIILLKSSKMPFFTDMKLVFEALDGFPNNYEWLISEFEYNYCTDERLWNDPVVIGGNELEDLLNSNDIQFIWGVFSAFPKGTPINIDASKVPVSDGKRISSLSNPPSIQCPGAVLEIICFDSSFTLVVGADSKIQKQFMDFFPEAEDLDEYNRINKRR